MIEPWQPASTAPRDGTRIRLRGPAIGDTAVVGRWDNGVWALEAEEHTCRGTRTVVIDEGAVTEWAFALASKGRG
jgi:hypothetical protein